MADEYYVDVEHLGEFHTSLLTYDSTVVAMDGTRAAGTSKKAARADHVHPTDTSRAAATHSHGNITSGGDITATAPTVASGDKLIINDESASKITNGPSFGTSTTTFLANNGTWQTPAGTTYSDFTSPTSSAAGTRGLVPAPPAFNPSSGTAQILTGKGWYSGATVGVQQDASGVAIYGDLGSYTLAATPIAAATSTVPGIMSAADKSKLDGVATGAEVNQNAFAKVAVSGVTVEADAKSDTLTLSAGTNITLTANASTDTVTISASDWPTYDDFTGATASASGVHGLVPKPLAGDQAKFLQGSGDWESLPILSQTSDGVLPAIGDMSSFEEVSFLKLLWDGESPDFDWGALESGDIPNLPASHITTGTFDAARIPNLAASKITSGTLGVGRGGTGVSTLGAGVVYHSASGTGALSIATASNLVSAIGNTAVNRATADADGNTISTTYAKKSDVTGIYKYVGSVATQSALPSSGVSTGDVYDIVAASDYGPAGTNVAWTGSAWDSLGGTFSINTVTSAQIQALFA